MQDETFSVNSPFSDAESPEPNGSLRRALYLWERQPPSAPRPFAPDGTEDSQIVQTDSGGSEGRPESSPFNMSAPADMAIETELKRHAARLSALERIIPGDRRLDPPRFSLMMLNAFLGRAVTDGAVLSRLPGLYSISERIAGELTDLEREYPDALAGLETEPDPTPILLRDEMRQLISDLKSQQKAQQRQVVSSLAALHTAINDLRSRLPDREERSEQQSEPVRTGTASPMPSAPVDDLARPLIDPERLVDPRSVLAAARAAASRANLELAGSRADQSDEALYASASRRPYRSVLLGSAFLGLVMILFGREAVQFLSSTSLNHGLAQP